MGKENIGDTIMSQHVKEEKKKKKDKGMTLGTKVAVGTSVVVAGLAIYGMYKLLTSNYVDEDVGFLSTTRDENVR